LYLNVLKFLDHRHVRPQHLEGRVIVAEAANVDLRVTGVSGEVLLLRRLHPRRRRPHRDQGREIEGRREEEGDRQAEVDPDPLQGPGPGN